jgi:hypothetical protein
MRMKMYNDDNKNKKMDAFNQKKKKEVNKEINY